MSADGLSRRSWCDERTRSKGRTTQLIELPIDVSVMTGSAECVQIVPKVNLASSEERGDAKGSEVGAVRKQVGW